MAQATVPRAARQPPRPVKSKLDEVRTRGKVIVGVTSEAPPFGFIDEKGELVGFDIDVAKLIAKGIFGDDGKIELFKQGFAARWPNTQNGSIDFGIMVTTVYPDRVLQVAFTRPYIDSGIVIVVQQGQPGQDDRGSQQGRPDCRPPDRAGAGRAWQAALPNAKFLTFDAISAQFNAVKLGRATACQLDAPVALYYLKDNPEFRIVDEWLTDVTGNAVFLRHDDFKWWLFLDTMVAEMLGGQPLERLQGDLQEVVRCRAATCAHRAVGPLQLWDRAGPAPRPRQRVSAGRTVVPIGRT